MDWGLRPRLARVLLRVSVARGDDIYADSELAAETFRVIGEAMAHTNEVGPGSVTILSRDRRVLVEPRRAGLVLSAPRSADEARPAEAGSRAEIEIDTNIVAIAETIIERRSGAFAQASFRDMPLHFSAQLGR